MNPQGANISLERSGLFGVHAVAYDLKHVPGAAVLTYQKTSNVPGAPIDAIKFTPILGKACFDVVYNGKLTSTSKLAHKGDNLHLEVKMNTDCRTISTNLTLYTSAVMLDAPIAAK